MATLAEIYDWFMTGKKPTQAQFWASWGSFWNKGESIPQSAISNLTTVLNAKAEKVQFDAHKTDATAHAAILVEPNARIAALEAKTDSSNNFKFIPNPGYTFDPVTRVLTMAAGWVGTINDEDYTNVATQEFPAIALSNSGYSRIELIVFKEDSTFEKLVGAQSTTTPVAPVQPANTLEAMFLTVGDGVVSVPVTPKPKAPVTSVNGMRGDVVIEIAAATDTAAGMVKIDAPMPDPVVYTKATSDNLLKAKVNAILEIKPITGIAYTLTAYDTENLVQLAYDGTLPMTVTIPNDATLNLPVGSIFYTVGSNTGAVTIAGGSGVTFQTAVGLTAGQNETRKYVKKAANTWQIEGGAQPMAVGGAKTYKTYFVNTSTGNNATGVYEDATKPFASIDYVLALSALKDGDIVFMQNAGTFPLNGLVPEKTITFYSDLGVTLDFSGNANSNLLANSNAQFTLTFDLKKGLIKNERSGGSGAKFQNYNSANRKINIFSREIYLNTSTPFCESMPYDFEVEKMSIRTYFINHDPLIEKTREVKEFVCLANNASICNGWNSLDTSKNTYIIRQISGSGSYRFSGGTFFVGNISTTNVCSVSGTYCNLHFMNSVITTANGIELGASSISVFSGIISSVSKITHFDKYSNTPTYFINFKADFGLGQINVHTADVYVDNSSMKSTNSLFAFQSTGSASISAITVKNSTFEVVNAVPLVTGGSTAVSGNHTLKVGGISTNATMLSDQNGTGVTVTQYTNY